MANKHIIKIIAQDMATAVFKKIKQGLNMLKSAAKLAAAGLMKISLAAAAAATALVASIAVSTRFVDALVKTADKLDVNIEFLQKFRFAADQIGVSTRTADMALQRFARRLGEAKKGTGELLPALREMGLSQNVIADLGAEEALMLFADALATTEDSTNQLALAFKGFDSEGAALVSMLRNGSDGLQQFFDDADRLGFILTDSAARGVGFFADELTRLRTLIGGVSNQLTATLAPALSFFVDEAIKKIHELRGDMTFEDIFKNIFRELTKGLVNFMFSFENAINQMITLFNDIASITLSDAFIKPVKFAAAFGDSLANVNKIIQDGFIPAVKDITESTEPQFSLLEKLMTKIGVSFAGVQTGLRNFAKDTDDLFANTITNAFKGAEDAIVDFVMTGKASFKELVNSIISDLIRMQVRAQIMKFASFLFPNIDFGARALGGPVMGGQPFLVGEKGPEMFIPTSNGRIATAGETKGMAASSSNVNISFNVSANDASGFETMLSDRKNQIVSMVVQAMNQKGKPGII